MGRRIQISVGEYYHVYNRGVDRRIIFKDKHDYLRFIVLLKICNTKNQTDVYQKLQKKEGPSSLNSKLQKKGGPSSLNSSFLNLLREDVGEELVSIGAYCLMPNHFHILFREKTEGGISSFMRKLGTAYAMYFNNRYKRTGSLFEGRFKAEHVVSDAYLKYLYAYIHLNPIKLIDSKWKENGIHDKKEALAFLSNYEFSSYLVYLGNETLQQNILSKAAFPQYFKTHPDFKKMINFWISYGES